MAKKLVAMIRPTPHKPLAEMTEAEAREYASRLFDEQLAPKLKAAGIKVVD